jgi:hypothetical protein
MKVSHDAIYVKSYVLKVSTIEEVGLELASTPSVPERMDS